MRCEGPYWAIALADGTEYILGEPNGITVTGMSGVGMPPVANVLTPYALLDGASWQRTRLQPRVIQLALGVGPRETRATYFELRRALVQAVSPHRVSLPLELRYYGYDGLRRISCYYDAGLELGNEQAGSERLVLRLLAPDPLFYGDETSVEVDDAESLTASMLISVKAGTWSAIGVAINNPVYALALGPDGLYVGGAFSTINGVARYYIARWDGTAWHSLGPGLDNAVYAIAVGHDGLVYVGGSFTDVYGGPGGTYNRVAAWDPVAGTWNALGEGADQWVGALAWGHDGVLYAGGTFYNIGGVAAVHIASWDGAVWSALGDGVDGGVLALDVGIDGNLYVGGVFTTAGSVTARKIAMWDGASWSALGSGMDVDVNDLCAAADGRIYAGGRFTTAGGNVAKRAAVWNGNSWSPLGEGFNDEVLAIIERESGSVVLGGWFDKSGDLTTLGIAEWNGYSVVSALVNLTSPMYNGWAHTLLEDASEGVLYIGGYFSGDTVASKVSTVVNPGTANSHPVISVTCPIQAGDPKPVLLGIHNETTGARLWFNYAILEGETVTIDCRPGMQRISSSFRGSAVGNNPLPGSHLAQFSLAPGINRLSVFVWDDALGPGSTTVTVKFKPAYLGID